jgi:hypothetical protein
MKRDIAVVIGLSLVIVLAAYVGAVIYYCGGLYWKPYCAQLAEFGSFYGKNLRGSLFTGFLTLGGFLLSLKTFIVVNMKKEVFDTDDYKLEWEEQKKLDTSNKMGPRFEPLRYLSLILFLAIVSCVTTAVLQLTLGLAETLWAAIVCLWAAVVSVILLLRSLWLIRVNLNRMFDFLDAKK